MLSVFSLELFGFFLGFLAMVLVSFHHRNSDGVLLTYGVLQKCIKWLCSREKIYPTEIITDRLVLCLWALDEA